MRKKVILGFLAFSLIAGTAYAAGNTVSVLVNGKPVQSGQIIDGSTMLPLRAIGEALGANVEWDNVRKQANITMPQKASQSATEGLSLAELNKIGESVPMIYALDANGNAYSQGSGVVIDGMVVTNHHVVEGSASLRIHFGGDVTTLKSDYVIYSPEHDLAAVALPGYKSLGVQGGKVENGAKLYAIGHPDQKFQISEGESLGYTTRQDLIVHSASTSPGSSGGAVVDSDGNVVAITVGNGEGTIYNHAIPVSTLLELMAGK